MRSIRGRSLHDGVYLVGRVEGVAHAFEVLQGGSRSAAVSVKETELVRLLAGVKVRVKNVLDVLEAFADAFGELGEGVNCDAFAFTPNRRGVRIWRLFSHGGGARCKVFTPDHMFLYALVG